MTNAVTNTHFQILMLVFLCNRQVIGAQDCVRPLGPPRSLLFQWLVLRLHLSVFNYDKRIILGSLGLKYIQVSIPQAAVTWLSLGPSYGVCFKNLSHG